MVVIGIARRKGDYNGNPYDNKMLYCLRPADVNRGEVGQISEVIKVKTVDFPSIIEVGMEIEPVYDRYGRVTDIRIV